MVTFVVIILIAVIAFFIWGIDKYKQERQIAKAIDGSGVTSTITENTQKVIEQLRDIKTLKLVRYTNTIKMPDSQEISYRTDDFDAFRKKSKLKYEPTMSEWKILLGVVKKFYSNL